MLIHEIVSNSLSSQSLHLLSYAGSCECVCWIENRFQLHAFGSLKIGKNVNELRDNKVLK
jgi:hypothetical protein